MLDSTPDSPRFNREPLSPIDVARSDADIRTFVLLRDGMLGEFSIGITGGYAVDAYDGGEITRPHADMDATIYLGGRDPKEAVEAVRDILALDSSQWEQVVDKDLPNVHFKGVSSDGSERRLELYLSEHEARVEPRVLLDSKNFRHAVDVQEVPVLLANKIIFMLKHKEADLKWRDAKDSDVDDMRRLARLPGYDEAPVIDDMVAYYRYVKKIDRFKAQIEAERDYRSIEAEIFPDIKPAA